MKSLARLSIIPAALAFICAAQAVSIPFKLDDGVDDRPSSSGDSQVQSWLTELAGSYGLPTDGIGAKADFKLDVANGGKSIELATLSAHYQYLVFHWGGNKRKYDTYQAYYLPSATFDATTFESPAGGLSWYAYYAPRTEVPESGASGLLLGLGLVGLIALGKKFRK